MADDHWTTKVGDTQTPLEAKLTERDPAAVPVPSNPDPRRGIDLAAATGVAFHARSRDRKRTITGSCETFTPSPAITGDDGKGWVRWRPQASDVSAKGIFSGEFKISWPGGAVQTVPNSGAITFEVEEGIP